MGLTFYEVTKYESAISKSISNSIVSKMATKIL